VQPTERPVDLVPRASYLQEGTFTVAQALTEGWTLTQIRHRRRRKYWIPVAGIALARAQAEPWSVRQLATAAQLTWPDCVISHRPAAALYGFSIPGEIRTADVITSRGRPSGRSIRAHVLSVWPGDACRVGGLLTTTKSRTAFDCLRILSFTEALNLWAWLSTRGVANNADLTHELETRSGWRGTPQLRKLAQIIKDGAVSGAEFTLQEILRTAKITGWSFGAKVFDRTGLIGVVDVLFAAKLVVIEVDGYTAHSSREAFVRDRRRQNRLQAAGFFVLRFTWDDLQDRPGAVVAEIRTALSRQHGL
jgi:very-short-patch-repair endonuclease